MARTTQTAERVRDRALELGIYLPLGALATAREELADLNAPKLRKAYTRLVDRGQDRVEPIERLVRRRANRAEREVSKRVDETVKDVKKTARKTTKRATAATNTIAPRLPRVAAPRKASELAIAGYDGLTASEVVAELKGLTQTELAKVYKYERANQNRSTILETLEGRFVELPIPTYDALTVEEINGRLENLSEGDLKTIRRYESETKERTTILDRIDSLLS